MGERVPAVSVLIPTRNNRAELRACLESLRQLEYPKERVEIVVFDNGSRDDTRPTVRALYGAMAREGWGRLALEASDENLGAFGGRAAAFPALDPRADFVLSLDDDVESEPDALARLVRAAADPRVGVVGARIVYWDAPAETASAAGDFEARIGRFRERRPATAADCDFVSSCGCLIRRAVMEALGGFDGSFFTSHGDVDLCLRARQLGFAVRYEPTAVIRHRVARGGTRTPERVYYGYRNKLLLLRRHVPPRWRPLAWTLYATAWLPRILADSLRHHRGVAPAEIRAIFLAVLDGVRCRWGRAPWFEGASAAARRGEAARMVICLVSRRIWTHGQGGMEEHCRNAAMELTRQGHAVHVLTTAHPDGRACEVAYGATVHYLPGTPPGAYSRAWSRASRHWAREHFRDLGVDAVLSMSVAAYGLVDADGPPIYPIVVGWLPGQLVSSWRDGRGWRRLFDFPRSARWQLGIWLKGRRLLRHSTRILAVSHAVAHELRRYRGVCRLPNYVDTSQFVPSEVERARVRAELGFTDRDCVALITSTITWQKGVHLGLRACAAVADLHPGLATVVAGDGPAAAPIEAEARRVSPRLRVRFLGAIPHDDLPPLYAAADLFLLPSLRVEGLPTTVLEAMSAGLPVVAMRAGGTPTAVVDGGTGLLVRQGDLAAFTEAMRALVGDPDRRRAMGNAGRARAVTEFDQAIVVRRMVDIMRGSRC